jgi:hypothetical protein
MANRESPHLHKVTHRTSQIMKAMAGTVPACYIMCMRRLTVN